MNVPPTTNLLTRVFPVRWNDLTGTAFVIDRDHRQYLITAKHVVDGIVSGQELTIRMKHYWYNFKVVVVGIGGPGSDVAVLSCCWPLAHPAANLDTDLSGIAIGQDVFVAGFPFEWGSQVRMGDQISDFPFVRKGTLSNLLGTEHGIHALVLDMHNNPGFSGSPVCFRRMAATSENAMVVAGVVTSYPAPERRPVIDDDWRPVDGLFFAENSGFTEAHTIGCVTDIIDRNPVGLRIDWLKEALGGDIFTMLKLAEEAGVSLAIPSTASTENI